MTFNPVHPGCISGGKNEADAVLSAPFADFFFAVRGEVIQHYIGSSILEVLLANGFKETEKLPPSLSGFDDSSQFILTYIVGTEQVLHPVRAGICRRKS